MTKLAVLGAIGVLVLAPALTATTASAATSADCGARPGGGWVYTAKTKDSSPVRTGPYEACAKRKTYAAGKSVQLACWLTNSYGNLWYKENSSNLYIYGGHFAASVKSHVEEC
ncbi:hypothetical protein [Kribbella sp. NPDC051770]|uniref:hypothetical protein n=1 Tax=Kribbella sp. NPDC051770 TaxID=3155413 RepID=UPI00342DDB35